MAVFSVISNSSARLLTPVNLITLLFFWICIVIAYRLWLGPLASVPGPKLAALTGWYETYFECVQRGRYWVEIERMHEQYGKLCCRHRVPQWRPN